MSHIKSMDKSLYSSISEAISKITERYIANDSEKIPIYGSQALEHACAFLCINNIPHQFMTLPAPSGASFDEIVSLVWENEDGEIGNQVWYACKNKYRSYRVTMYVTSETEGEIEDWLSHVDEFEISDYEVEEAF